MNININRLVEMFERLKSFNDTPGEGYTRRVFTNTERRTLTWFESLLKENNLYSHTDEVGNVFGIYGQGDCPVLIGSHLDTVQNGGLYDGALGVLSGLEVLLTLKENNVKLERPIMLVAFRGEEANVLGGTFGSRVFAKIFDSNNDDLLTVGLNKESVQNSGNQEGFHSYIELHIEQGEVLETKGIDIGIVTSIAGLRRYKVEVVGKSGHSGTTPMHMRQDALKEATKELQSLFQFSETLDEQTVLTVGKLDMFPNQANVIPNKVEFLVEIRSDSDEKLDEYEDKLEEVISVPFKNIVTKAAAKLDNASVSRLCYVSEEMGYSYLKMVSGANHDANAVSTIMPTSMVFIPSRDGVSHHPDEYSSQEQIEKGCNLILNYILEV